MDVNVLTAPQLLRRWRGEFLGHDPLILHFQHQPHTFNGRLIQKRETTARSGKNIIQFPHFTSPLSRPQHTDNEVEIIGT